MGSRTQRTSGVSPGESKARTGAAVGPGSISGLPRNVANEVLSRAERLRGDNLTPETVRIASEFLGLPDRSGPGMKMFALPPSVRDKDILTEFMEKTDGPPSMTIPQLPNTPPPGYEFSPNLPNTLPPGFEPEKIFPNTPPPGTSEMEVPPALRPGRPPETSRGRLELPLAIQRVPGGLSSLIIRDLIDRGLLDG